jgi:high-affinity Fe2+/Pb2+ permease
MIALLLTIAAFGTAWKSRSNSRIPLGISAACIFACTLTYQIYFAGANAEFLNRSIELQLIGNAIHLWATWHWLRTSLTIAALTFSSWALLTLPKNQDDRSDSDLPIVN